MAATITGQIVLYGYNGRMDIPAPALSKGHKAPAPTKRELAVHRAFARAYLVCRDPVRAGLMIGMRAQWAEKICPNLLLQPTVIKYIREYELATPETPAERTARYRAWLEQEATFSGKGSSHSARVQAIVALTKLDALESESAATPQVGVMVVPADSDPASWEKRAAALQADLRADIRE